MQLSWLFILVAYARWCHWRSRHEHSYLSHSPFVPFRFAHAIPNYTFINKFMNKFNKKIILGIQYSVIFQYIMITRIVYLMHIFSMLYFYFLLCSGWLMCSNKVIIAQGTQSADPGPGGLRSRSGPPKGSQWTTEDRQSVLIQSWKILVLGPWKSLEIFKCWPLKDNYIINLYQVDTN